MDMKTIGLIHTPFDELEGMPIQPKGALGVKGTIVVKQAYLPGLNDLDGFSHLILIYQFHLSKDFKLEVTPFLDTATHGVFATRAPKRPNPIGISVVQLDGVEENRLHVSNIDVLNGTPLLDIKPLVPEFDCPREVQTGWLAHSLADVSDKKSDGRFNK